MDAEDSEGRHLTTRRITTWRIGDLLPRSGYELRIWNDAEVRENPVVLQDMVPPACLRRYRAMAIKRPVGRSHLASREDREECVFLAAAFFLDMRREQILAFTSEGARYPLTPPCSRCGLPTGSWCGRYRDVELQCARPLCTTCDKDWGIPCCISCDGNF